MWNSERIFIAMFEHGSSDVLIDTIERASGRAAASLLPASDIVYALVADLRDPAVVWAATSRSAQVFKVDTAAGKVTKVADLGKDRFIFAMAQAPDGTLFLGTYPDAKLYALAPSTNFVLRELDVARRLVGPRTNVQTVIAPNDTFVFFHIGSPGILIAYERKSGKAAEVLRTKDPFLFPARDFPKVIPRIRSSEDLRKFSHPETPDTKAPPEPLPEWVRPLLPDTEFKLERDKFELVVQHDGRSTRLSAMPRQAGMPIVALSQVSDRLAVGSTYWNQWLFTLDTQTGELAPRGPIGDTGEFFAACRFRNGILIPHYLGQVLFLRPDLPVSRTTTPPNPRELFKLADGHIGLSCTELGNGKAVYAMLPNYGQINGELVAIDGSTVTAKRSIGQTVSRLAKQGTRLYGATAEFIGLGQQRSGPASPLRVVELDPEKLDVIRQVEVPVERHRNATGLISLSDDTLLLGVEGGGLFLVNTAGHELSVQRIGQRCVGVSSIVSVGQRQAVALCGDKLYALAGNSRGLAAVADAPTGSSFLASGPDGQVFVTTGNHVFRVDPRRLRHGLDEARRILGGGRAISNGDLRGYLPEYVLTKSESAWNSVQVGEAAVRDAFVGLDFGERRAVAARHASIVWVVPETTPRAAAIEYSDDGKDWQLAMHLTPTRQPKGGKPYWSQEVSWSDVGQHRFWRLRPTKGPVQNFAVEFLELQVGARPD